LRTRSLLFVVAGLAVAATLLLVGCPAKQTETPATPVPTPSAAPKTAAETGPAPTEFTWADAPTVAQVPSTPVKGIINGKEFTANTVRVEKGDEGKATLEISDAKLDDPTGVITDDTGVDLDFTLTEGQPGEMVMKIADEKNFDKEHAYYHYPQGGDKGPMSVNPDWGCALQIESWDMTPDAQNEKILGKITGKVAIVFGDDSKSWVAGTFEAPYYKW